MQIRSRVAESPSLVRIPFSTGTVLEFRRLTHLWLTVIEFKNLEKNIKADLYFTVSLGTTIVPSAPRKAKDTTIGIEDAL